MLDRDLKYGIISVSLILVVFLSLVIVAPVSAPSVGLPPNCYNPQFLPLPVKVPVGEVFLLRGSITFDQPDTGHLGLWIIYWYDNGDPAENFVLENTPSVYWSDASPVENVVISDYAIDGGWQVEIEDNGDGIARNGTFYINIWLRAASGDGTPHRVDNQNIYDIIWLSEPTQYPWWPDGTLSYLDVIEVQMLEISRGVNVFISPEENSGPPGETIDYTVTVKNAGNVSDNYLLTVSDDLGWGPVVEDNLLEVPAGGNGLTTLSVTIPDTATLGTEDNIIVVATSMENTEIRDNDSCTGHVVSWMGAATFKLENLYKLSLEKDLQLYAGRKLVVKFYRYDNTLQTESVIHNFTPPENIKDNENVSQPRGAERYPWGTVQIARLTLADNSGNVISTIASFAVHQSDLRNRYMAILVAWAGNPGQQSAFRREVMDILRQWSSAPPAPQSPVFAPQVPSWSISCIA
jgi:hypothetical protein